jgi:lysophospholipase L1-like esterase
MVEGTMFLKRAALLAVVIAILGVPATHCALAQTWVGTWTASPQSPRGVMPARFLNQTVRQIVRVSIGGSKIRVRLSNEFGSKPVVIGAASVGQVGKVAGSLRPLTFAGAKHVTLLPGAPALSDPVELNVAPLSELAINLYLPAATEPATVHQVGLQTAYVSAPGDFTASVEFPVADRFTHRFFLSGVLVEPSVPARAIVTFGDSITDGANSTVDANGRWPDVLARRLNDSGAAIAVLNQGISGNRVLSDGAGVSGLARFERDVLSQPAVSHVVIMLGINDIGWPGTAIEPNGIIRTADDIVAGYKQMIERARVRSIKVIGATLTPFENALSGRPNQGYFTLDKEVRRLAVNHWIRTSGAFDATIDFDRVIADPRRSEAIAAPYDSGDHLHPNDAGYRAMGEAVELKLFQ